MTAYLQPGDRIHLAFQASDHPNAAKAEAQVKDDARDFTAAYAQQGVTVETWSANSALTHPVVVAVFRDKGTTDPSGSTK